MNEEFIIRKLLKSKIKGVDNYKHNGSTWLIFTSEKKWVIELTPQGTLWYNYYFFSEIFNFVGLDVVENQHYITKWVEDTIQNGVKDILKQQVTSTQIIENTIQNGVKRAKKHKSNKHQRVEDTIKNGVKNTKGEYYKEIQKVEYTIQNGIKETRHIPFEDGLAMEEVIQNGVKNTEKSLRIDGSCVIEDTIQNGVRHTQGSIFDNPTTVKDTIQNGVKVTYSDKIPHQYDWTNQFTDEIEDIIENGVKYTEIGWSQYNNVDGVIENGVKYTGDRQGDYNLVVEDTIQNGIKHTDFLGPGRPEMVEKVIINGVKETESIASHRTWKSDVVIQNGIKETNPHFLELINPINLETVIEEMKRTNEVNIVLNNCIKETTPGGYLGFVERKGKTIHQFETAKQLYYVEDVIEYGIKKTEGAMLFDESQIDTVISDGIKEVQPLPSQEGNKDWGIYYHRQEVPTKPHTQYVDDVVRDGVKETSWRKVDNYPTYTDNVIERGEKC